MARTERLLVKTGMLIRETEAAYLVDFDNAGETWVPKSQVIWDGGSDWSMPEWLAAEKDL